MFHEHRPFDDLAWSRIRDRWLEAMRRHDLDVDPVVEIPVIARTPFDVMDALVRIRATWWPRDVVRRTRAIELSSLRAGSVSMGDEFFDRTRFVSGAARGAALMLAERRGDDEVRAATFIAMSGLPRSDEFSSSSMSRVTALALHVLRRNGWTPTWRSNQTSALPVHLDLDHEYDTDFGEIVDAMIPEHVRNLTDYTPIVLQPYKGDMTDNVRLDYDDLRARYDVHVAATAQEFMRTWMHPRHE